MEDGSPDLSWLCDGVLNFDNITPVDIDISEKHRGPQAGGPTILPRWTYVQAKSGKSGTVPVI
jgi:hypothetical protein